jgi:hypothetical protein
MAYGIEKLQQLGYKSETIEGTAETLVAADFDTPVYSFSLERERDIHERRPLRSSFAPVQSVGGAFRGKATVSGEVRGSAVDNTPPDWYALARSAGATLATDVLSFGVAITSATEIGTSLTLIGRDSINARTIAGARGSLKLIGEGAGMPIKFEYEGFGSYSEAAQDSMLAAAAPQAGQPAILMGSALSTGGVAVEYRAVEFAIENEVLSIKDGSKANGYGKHLITGQKLTLMADVWITTASADFWAKSANASSADQFAISWTFGSGTGLQFVLAGTAHITEAPNKTYNDGLMSIPLKLEFTSNSDAAAATITQS